MTAAVLLDLTVGWLLEHTEDPGTLERLLEDPEATAADLSAAQRARDLAAVALVGEVVLEPEETP